MGGACGGADGRPGTADRKHLKDKPAGSCSSLDLWQFFQEIFDLVNHRSFSFTTRNQRLQLIFA